MGETAYIAALEKALRALPSDQRADIVAEYRSHFFEAKGRGKSDEEIAKAKAARNRGAADLAAKPDRLREPDEFSRD